jgi:hypothetical protein
VLATGLNRPLNLVVDETRVFWTNGGHGNIPDGSLDSVAKTGVDRLTLAKDMVRPGNPVLAGDRIFWTVREQPTGRILAMHKDGSDAVPTEIATNISNASDMQLAGTTLVWSTSGTEPEQKNPVVERANLDGSARMPLATGIPTPSFQIGVAPDAVFVGSVLEGTVRRLPFNLSGPKLLAAALVNVQEVVADAATLFLTTGNGGRVLAIPIAGGSPIVLANGQTYPSYIAMDADYVYWTDGPLSGAATIRRAKKPGH